MSGEQSNWSGFKRFTPSVYAQPGSLDEIVAAVNDSVKSGRRIRVAGNHHSFSSIVDTEDTLISLDRIQGLIDVDRSTGLARVHAGTSIFNLSRALDEHGLALPNLGDIDVQSVAGAAATGTHGTGQSYASVSAAIAALKLVTATGDVVEIDESDLTALKAARVSLGTFGVVTELTLKCIPAFRLDRFDTPRPLNETLDNFDQLNDDFEHFEFYVFPYTEVTIEKRINRSQADPKPWSPFKRVMNDHVFENWTLAALVNAGRLFPKAIPSLSRAATKTFSDVRKLDKSFEVFSTVRNVRFNELEYAVPREHGRAAIERVLAMVEQRKFPINFPIEVRTGRADPDCLLSTSAGRDTVYISVHTYRKLPCEDYFHAVEEIMDGFAGRPHWGKLNWQTAEKLAPRYEGWDDFQAVRARLDPQGTFSNQYVERILGPVRAPTMQ